MTLSATGANDPEEEHSHHHRKWFGGFGPVRNGEVVMFAVFEDTPVEGVALAQDSFESNRLKKHAQSLTRTVCVTRNEFVRKIIRGKVLRGVSTAQAADLRALTVQVELQGHVRRAPSLCLLDKVERGEPDGHATMGFTSHTTSGVGQGQLRKIRERIMLDVADVFTPIASADSQPWPNILATLGYEFGGQFLGKAQPLHDGRAPLP